MGKKKKTEEKKTDEEEADEETVENHLRESLEEIKTYDGVIGYILRNSTSAAIDLKDPTNIIDYAILSSSAIDASETLTEDFDLGNAKNIVIEGNDAKILSLTIDENKISIFMDKEADCQKVLRKIR